jgi:hypothetical protein
LLTAAKHLILRLGAKSNQRKGEWDIIFVTKFPEFVVHNMLFSFQCLLKYLSVRKFTFIDVFVHPVSNITILSIESSKLLLLVTTATSNFRTLGLVCGILFRIYFTSVSILSKISCNTGMSSIFSDPFENSDIFAVSTSNTAFEDVLCFGPLL